MGGEEGQVKGAPGSSHVSFESARAQSGPLLFASALRSWCLAIPLALSGSQTKGERREDARAVAGEMAGDEGRGGEERRGERR